MTTQLKLPIALRDSASFANFFVGDNDELLASLAHLGELGANGNLFVHGPPGAGKTHLLQALSRQAIEAGGDALYVPLSQSGVAPALVSELSDASLVCIDDAHQIAGLPDWEEALLELYERLLGGAGALVVAADLPPRQLDFYLADLSSRLGAGSVYALKGLTEQQLPAAMRLRAQTRGLALPDNTIEYLLRRFRRDSTSVFSILDQVDEAAWQYQRRLTVPFVKEIEKDLGR